MDLDGSTVADAARAYGFANAAAGLSIADLPDEVPLFIVRAGRDENPGLNESLDRFVHGALRHNLPVTVVNHATAGHAFEIRDPSEATRSVIRQMLAFLQHRLAA
jgi:hypothetical protein